MKGLRLFVRRATPADDAALRLFWTRERREPPPPARDRLLGFLLGEIAAVVSFDHAGDAVAIRDLWVARNLRRKRVARAILTELEHEALRLGSARLLIHPAPDIAEAARRLGFADAGDGVLARPVEPAS